MKKKAVILISVLLAVVALVLNTKATMRFEAQFLGVFDTVSSIIGYTSSKDEFQAVAQKSEKLLKEYHELYDIYNDYEGINNIKTINDNAGIQPVEVDNKIIELLEFSKYAYELTDGKVNVAFGSVLSIWHEERSTGIDQPQLAKLPKQSDLEDAVKYTNIENVIIDRDNSTVYLKEKGMRLDVGAIAKGYAVEMVCRELEKEGYDNMLFSVGGNIRAIGKRGDRKNWVVPVESPYKEREEKYICTTALNDQSLISSGDYQRYYTVDGKSYHHIIDPDTLYPATYHKAVTVMCKDSGLADVLTTGLFLMDIENGQNLVESMDGVEAVWAENDGTLIYSSGFEYE